MTGGPEIARLVAYEEIRQLAARYAVATDARDLDTLVSLFVEDVHVGRELRGREALKEFFTESLRGVVYCRAEVQDGDRWIVQAIQYRDEYSRRAGHWYFVRRKHLLWYGRDVGTNPLGLRPANWPEHHDGWGELPEASPTWAEFWGDDAPQH